MSGPDLSSDARVSITYKAVFHINTGRSVHAFVKKPQKRSSVHSPRGGDDRLSACFQAASISQLSGFVLDEDLPMDLMVKETAVNNEISIVEVPNEHPI